MCTSTKAHLLVLAGRSVYKFNSFVKQISYVDWNMYRAKLNCFNAERYVYIFLHHDPLWCSGVRVQGNVSLCFIKWQYSKHVC